MQPQLRAGEWLGNTEGCLPNSGPTRKEAGRNQDTAKLLTHHPSKSAIWAGLSTANQEPRLTGAAPKLEVEGRATAAHMRKATKCACCALPDAKAGQAASRPRGASGYPTAAMATSWDLASAQNMAAPGRGAKQKQLPS